MEYTLEDAFKTVNSKIEVLESNIQDLTKTILNNDVSTLKSTSSLEYVKTKHEHLQQCLLEEIEQVQPEDYPLPRTCDLRTEVITEMEEEIRNTQQLLHSLEKNFSDIQQDIAYLKNKGETIKKMQSAFLNYTKLFVNITYEKENEMARRLFREVKHDLRTVVNTLFPANDNFKELLAALTSAYLKGGDNVYIDVTQNILSHVQFLLEADIITYHRNDKTKIKMNELL